MTLTNSDKKWFKDNFLTKSDAKNFLTKDDLKQTEKNIKEYIHQGVDASVEGVDNLFQEYQVDSRIKNLERIHPSGKHIFEN